MIFWPKSEIQTFFSPKIRWSPPPKKKKKVLTKIETDFSAGFVTFRSVGGDASRNGAELFKIRADFSAKIVTFRLVGGGASPPSPPLNPPLVQNLVWNYGRLPSIPFLNSGIFHILHRNFRSISFHFPYHALVTPSTNFSCVVGTA